MVERNREEWNLKIQRASTLWAAVRAAGSICSANERKKGTKETSPRRGGRTGDRLFLLFFLSLSLSPRGVLSTGRAHVDRHRFNARSIAIFSNIKRKEAASKVSRRSVTQESTIRDPLLFYLSLSRNVYFETRVFLKEERKSVRALMLVEILAEIREGGGRERWWKERGGGRRARGERERGGNKGGRVRNHLCTQVSWRASRKKTMPAFHVHTFIRGEPKTNRDPSRGHEYTNALLPGNSIRFRRVWSSVRREGALPTLRSIRTRFKLSNISLTFFK